MSLLKDRNRDLIKGRGFLEWEWNTWERFSHGKEKNQRSGSPGWKFIYRSLYKWLIGFVSKKMNRNKN